MAAFDLQIMVKEAFQSVSGYVSRELQKGLPQDTDSRPGPLGGLQLRWGRQQEAVEAVVGTREITATLHAEDGCPACDLHAQMADVRGLADGLAASAQPDGSLPSPNSGTVPLIRTTLRQASQQADTLAQNRPDLRPQAEQLRAGIRDASQVIPPGRTATAEEARLLSEKVNDCWRQAYGLATAYWTPPAQSNVVRQWLQDTKREGWSEDEAMAKLQERLNANG